MAIGTTTALLLTLAAAGASAANQQRMLKKQDEQAAAGIRGQAENQREATANINRTISEIGKSDAAGAKKTVGKQYLDQVQRSLAQANAGLATRGLSSEFDERAGGAAASNVGFGNETADLLARMDAPVTQRQAEGNIVGDTSMDLSRIGGNVQGDQFVNNMKIQGIRKNPYVDIIAGLMGGAARGATGGSGGGMTINAGRTTFV